MGALEIQNIVTPFLFPYLFHAHNVSDRRSYDLFFLLLNLLFYPNGLWIV